MLRNRRLAITFTLLLGASLTFGDDSPLIRQVEVAIQQTHPDWIPRRAAYHGTAPSVKSEKILLVEIWVPKSDPRILPQNHVTVRVDSVESVTDARTALQPIREGKVAAGWTVQPFQIGEEGWLATNKNGSGYSIHFRTGLAVVNVSGAAIELVKSFAATTESAIAKNQK